MYEVLPTITMEPVKTEINFEHFFSSLQIAKEKFFEAREYFSFYAQWKLSLEVNSSTLIISAVRLSVMKNVQSVFGSRANQIATFLYGYWFYIFNFALLLLLLLRVLFHFSFEDG